jgi:molybdopterin/thiamine biosynthesis adenylyltransferase
METYQLKQFYSIKQFDNKYIHIGVMPPKALIIDHPPDFLSQLLTFFSEPKTEYEALQWINQQTNFSVKEAKIIVNELIENEIISTVKVDLNNRYSRHQLYFDLVGVEEPEEAQKILAKKKVGLIGMGGIGSNVSMILTAAGVGSLVLIDNDQIEESNLTRQFLYDEDSIGDTKVLVARKKLSSLNSYVEVVTVPKQITKDNQDHIFKEYISDCDFVVLSADSPFQIHTWLNNAALKYEFAYSNAGYIEAMGVVGPLVIPYETACYNCYKFTGDAYQYSANPEEIVNLNRGYQTPSFGPLNSLVSSIQANEVIRYFLGLDNRTKSCRLLIDSNHYHIKEENFTKRADCDLCS